MASLKEHLFIIKRCCSSIVIAAPRHVFCDAECHVSSPSVNLSFSSWKGIDVMGRAASQFYRAT